MCLSGRIGCLDAYPQLALGHLALQQPLVRLVRLRYHLLRCSFVDGLSVVAEGVEGLPIRHLVPPEPLSYAGYGVWVELLEILEGVDRVEVGVAHLDGDDLPVELAVVNHAQRTQHLDGRDGSHLEGLLAHFHHIQRVVVAERLIHLFAPPLVWVFPCLWEATVVPKDRAVVVSQLPLLDVLFDGVEFVLGVDLHLGLRQTGNLRDEVIQPLAVCL
mmetsp:Transcript_49682/g.124636  ORF Transcript_49682/g.124636 Transcript_49682/m.124636 type:complete len:216 (-) Transcript_49682:501-1148(-)